ncbi:Fanconi anemia group I protein homolog [Cydia splendana]|uniref:Fanconi anemia group I protein homolog n=1 Tax=Cydia splendana TaxID=1100963 RepID=UPI0028F49919
MEVNELFTKLKELGYTNTKRAELRELCNQKIDQILKYLPRRILNSDGSKIIDCLFNGFSDNTPSYRSKLKVIDIVIKTLRKESTSLTHCGDLISRIGLELAKAPASELVQWCNDTVQSIVDDSDVNMIWRDILPECLNTLSAADTVKHCGTDMTSAEYREQCIRTLCQCGWKERQLVQLTAMFNDMQLPRNEHKQVVNKICTYIMDCPPDTLPALVHQLIKLCKTHDFDIVLSHLGHYFSAQLYSKLAPPTPDSEATTMDIDDIVPHSPAEVSRCLSTCIYHIVEGMEKPQLCKVLRGWPRSQLLRAPFLLDLALALCAESDCRAHCLDVMKAGILSREADELVRAACAGARAVLPRAAAAAAVLRALTTESASHRQLTVLGLISLAFSLLSTPRGRPHASSCWSLAKLILARLSKAQPETAPHILATLADRLNTANPQRQYADCLFVLCKLTPISVERCSQLSAILENCRPSADFKSCALVLEAVHPLINFSARTRDCLFMVCRKGINSRDSAHRRLALSGFLTVLRHVKVSGTFSSSQSGYSEDSHASYLTQLTIVHSTQAGAPAASSVRNESVCLEVVSVLRRCLVQDAAVKQLLYTRLYECVKDKPALHECVLEFLNEHITKYLDEDQVLWDKCVLINGPTAVLVEPISHLLYVTAQFVQEDEEELEDILASQADNGSAVLRSKLALDLAKICDSERLGHIEVDDVGLSDLTPESKAKTFKVQQILSSYEALVAYQLMKWDRNSPKSAGTVLNLFKGYTQLLDNTKSTPKLGKKGSKSTLNETRETVKSQKSQRSQDKENRPVKVSNLTKDRGAPFKTLPCVWDLKVCLRVMELLYSEEVPWCTLEQRNRIRSSREFHHWSLRCVRSVVELSEKQGVKLITNIATIMYKRCVCRFRDMCEFDDTTALGCVELFTDCITFILCPDHAFKTDSFLSTITEISEEQESSYIATILEHVHTALSQVDEEGAEEGDSVSKKLVSACCQLAAVLLETPVVACERYTAAMLKLEDYVRTSKQDCLSLIPPLLTAGARIQQEAPLLDELLDKLASALGRIDEEDTSAGGEESPNFPSIDCRTGHTVLTHICVHLNQLGSSADHLLQRARDLDAALPLATRGQAQAIERELQEVYSAVILQLCQLTSWSRSACTLRCTVGVGSSRVLSSLARLYTLLATLVRQLTPVTLDSNIRSMERLLKLCGKKLSSTVDNLVIFLEASSKKARDTKQIPRVVFEAERFGRQVALLSANTKVNLMQYLPMGTARDFRIRAPVVEEMLKDNPEIDEAEDEDEPAEALSPAASDNEDSRDAEPPSKRRRS